jgi:general secretion pathway protein N
MTMGSRTARIGAFILIGLLSLFLLMPLGAAASALGLSARHSQGTILSGALRDVEAGGLRIGDVNARLRILPLFLGRLAFTVHRGDAPHAPGVSGTIGSGLGGSFAENLTATIAGDGILKGLEGSDIRLESLSFLFANGRCTGASGVVRLSLDETALGSAIRGGLMGNARCSNGDLLLPLMSASAMEKAIIRIKGDGTYQATLNVSDPAPEMAVALGLGGFRPIAGGYRLVRTGTLD